MKSYLFIAMLFMLSGCTLGELEGERDLGGRYYLLGYGSRSTISRQHSDKSSLYDDVLMGEIVDYDFDDNFIIAFRLASKEASLYGGGELWDKQRGIDSFQYWIIKKGDTAIGPLSKLGFQRKRVELGLSDLKLNGMK